MATTVERRKAYVGVVKCHCYYDYGCHIVCYWNNKWSIAYDIPCEIKHIILDFLGETEEKYVYDDIKLFTSITNDIDRIMESWQKCNLADTNKEFVGNFCGKIGTLKDVDPDGSSEIEFANFQCYLPSNCCTILDYNTDRSLISNSISSHC